MSFEEKLKGDGFVITTQINLNQFNSPSEVLKFSESVSPYVDAIIINENLKADTDMCPIATSHIIRDTGVDIVLNFTGNSHAKEKMLSLATTSWFLGIRNICVSENNTHLFNYKNPDDSKKGINTDEMHSLLTHLSNGKSNEKMDFFPGSIIDFEEKDFDGCIKLMEKDLKSGAVFFLTSPVYNTKIINALISTGNTRKSGIIVSINPGKTVHELEILRKHDERIVNDNFLKELKKSRSHEYKMLKYLASLIRNLRPSIAGVNIVAPKSQLMKLLRLAGLKSRLKKPVSVSTFQPHKFNQIFGARLTLKEFEKAYIIRVLKTTSGNRCKAANLLGIHRNTLMRKCEEYNIKL